MAPFTSLGRAMLKMPFGRDSANPALYESGESNALSLMLRDKAILDLIRDST